MYDRNRPKAGWMNISSAVGSRMYRDVASINAGKAIFLKRISLSIVNGVHG